MKQQTKQSIFSQLRLGAIALSIVIAGQSCQKQIAVNDGVDSRQVEVLKNKPGTEPIAQIAIDSGFTQLVAALSYVDQQLNAGLVNMFMYGKDQYTVFAPTNDAFETLYSNLSKPEAPVDEISDLPASLVLAVLKYHVTGGRRASFSVLPKNGMREISTLLEDASFWVDPNGMITAVGNKAQITMADINASNGIIHVIDQVILPIVP